MRTVSEINEALVSLNLELEQAEQLVRGLKDQRQELWNERSKAEAVEQLFELPPAQRIAHLTKVEQDVEVRRAAELEQEAQEQEAQERMLREEQERLEAARRNG